jgi:hypothetical protein
MSTRPEDRRETGLELAEPFFLDTEHAEPLYRTVAIKLKQRGLSRDAVERILIYEVAPVAGANFAYLVWPVIGAWASTATSFAPTSRRIWRDEPAVV